MKSPGDRVTNDKLDSSIFLLRQAIYIYIHLELD
jgi:hypothetical protein